MCRIWSSFAIAYIEMPDENTVISANETALKRARLLVEAQPQVFGHRARARAVVERHHEDAEEHHRRDRADPVEVARRDAVLRARRRHADDFLRAEVRREERQPADPRRQRPAGLEEVGAGLGVALEREADAEHEREDRRASASSRGRKGSSIGVIVIDCIRRAKREGSGRAIGQSTRAASVRLEAPAAARRRGARCSAWSSG